MPKRTDLETILVIGSGPIIIGQACEFDYSGTQACRVLASEGYRIVLVNSNPATIMTDPEFADATYVEPLDVESVARIIERERPDAILPTLGGQTGLNLAVGLHDAGVLGAFDVEMIGANVDAIRTAEDRQRFKAAMMEVGLRVPPSDVAYTVDEALRSAAAVGYPVIVRPAFILGGGGTGIAHNQDEMLGVAERGLAASPISEILIERSVTGWKEYELEVMRDHADNVVVICSIENVDAMGVHTGESITVAPAQTLTDREYQLMRDAAFACIRRIGVETGGSNVQFAVHPGTGEMVIIEMNPRVSRSSALASKATGFPIAKIAARLAVGYRLDEVMNDITRETPASFEPTIDYVVTKFPRWAFEKLPGAAPVLGTQMQSVGEVMAIGRTFPESLQKAIRSLETGRGGLNADLAEAEYDQLDADALVQASAVPTPERVFQIEAALRKFVSLERLYEVTNIDPWFLDQMLQIVEERERLVSAGFAAMTRRRRGARGAARGRCPHHLQDGRHVRRGVRRLHALPLRHLRGRRRSRTRDQTDGRDPRQRPEPHRPGRRVRLLLRARCVRAPRRGLRDRHGQLQPGDGLHRLRHERPSLLRTALPRRGAQRLRSTTRRGRGRGRGTDGCDRVTGWTDSAQVVARARAGRHHGARHEPGVDRPRRRPRAVQRTVRAARYPATAGRHRNRSRRGARRRRS
jgi:carbamoyl-phosphate synthase large subunit